MTDRASLQGSDLTATGVLSRIALLAGLSDELREQLAVESELVRLDAGQWLLREGDMAQSAYVVLSGRLELFSQASGANAVRILRRGEVIGELALLGEGVRSASVRASRDSELLELSRSAFEDLIRQVPSFALGLTRSLGAKLATSQPLLATPRLPRSIAVLELDGAAPALEVAVELAQALESHGRVVRLTDDVSRTRGEMTSALDTAERDGARVVMCPGSAAWEDVALREAELLLAVTSGITDEARRTSPALAGCELMVVGSRAAPEVAQGIGAREVTVVARGALRGAVEALARRLVGRSVAVVLSGGGARAFAHLGVLEELAAAGVQIDRFGGVSLGALVAARAAMGQSSDADYEMFARSFTGTRPTGDYTLPVYSLLRGRHARRLIERECFGLHIEELPKRFFCVSCDLNAREAVVHRTGPLSDALYASLALPGIFPPAATLDGRLLVDGGVLDNLPVATIARSGEGPVIAVDVASRREDAARLRRPRLARIGGPVRRFLTGSEHEIPHLGETILRTLTVGSIDTVAAARQHADLVISPRVEGVGLLDWGRLAQVRELGREAARAALEAGLPAALRV